LGNSVHAFSLFVTAFATTVSAHRIDHVLCAANPIQGALIQISFLVSHQLLGFLQQESRFVNVIGAICTLCFFLYVLFQPPFLCRHLCVSLATYYAFRFSASVYSSRDADSLNVLLILLFVSFAVSFIGIAFLRPFLTKRIGGYHRIHDCIFAGRQISDQISGLNLNQLSVHQVWNLARCADLVDSETMASLLSFLESRQTQEHFDQFFCLSLACRIARGIPEASSQPLQILEAFADEFLARRKRFWEAVWLSDFARLPALSAELGRHRLLLEQHLRYSRSVNPDSVKLQTLIARAEPIETCSSPPVISVGFVLVIIVFVHACVIDLHFYFTSINSTYLNTEFLDARKVLGAFSLMLSDIWCVDRSGADRFYSEFARLWENLVESGTPATEAVLNSRANGRTFRQLMDDYIDSFRLFRRDPNSTAGLSNPAVLNMFQTFFVADSAFYRAIFPRQYSVFFSISCGLTVVVPVACICLWYVSFHGRSNRRLRIIHNFFYLSKSTVAAHAGLDVGKLKPQISHLPPKPLGFQWGALRSEATILGLILVIVGCVWLQFFIGVSGVVEERKFMEAHFAHYSHADLIVLWFSFAQLMLSFHQDPTDAALHADQHLEHLYHSSEARYYISLFPANLRTLVGCFLTDDFIVPDPAESQLAMEIVHSALSESVVGHVRFRNLMLLRLLFAFANTIGLLLLAIFALRVLSSLILYEQNELGRQCEEFRAEHEVSTGRDSLPSINPADLPYPIVKVGEDGRIVFATRKAAELYRLERPLSYFNEIDFGYQKMNDINRALNHRKDKAEVIVVSDAENNEIFIYPIFKADSAIPEIESFVFVEVPAADVSSAARVPVQELIKSVFPVLKTPELPQTQPFRQPVVSIVTLQLLGLGRWSDNADPAVVDLFLREIVKAVDQVASESNFVRVHVIGNHICFVADSEEHQVQLVFFRVCISVGKKLLEAADPIAARFGASEIVSSVLFFRGNQVVHHTPELRCGQSDFLGEWCAYGQQLHLHFGVHGVGYAVGHKPANKFMNMCFLKTFQDINEKSVDLFVVI
jgi:hypothetical protein